MRAICVCVCVSVCLCAYALSGIVICVHICVHICVLTRVRKCLKVGILNLNVAFYDALYVWPYMRALICALMCVHTSQWAS